MDKQALYQHLFHAKGNCLTEEQLLSYVQGSLSHKEQHHIEKHLLSCELCDEAVEGLLLIQKERQNALISSTKKSILQKIHKTNYWAWAAIFSGIFLTGFSIFYFNNQLNESMNESKSMSYEAPSMATESTISNEEELPTETSPILQDSSITPTNLELRKSNEIISNLSISETKNEDLSTNDKPEKAVFSPQRNTTSSMTKDEKVVANDDMVGEEMYDLEEESFELKKERSIEGNSKAKIAQKKSISLGMNTSDEMKNIAFSKIPKDTSKAFLQFSAQNYQVASILYQEKLAKQPTNEWLIYTNSLLYLLLKQDEKAEFLIKEIEKSDKGQWLLACIYVKNEETKKAQKLLKKLVDENSIFSEDAKNILLKLNE